MIGLLLLFHENIMLELMQALGKVEERGSGRKAFAKIAAGRHLFFLLVEPGQSAGSRSVASKALRSRRDMLLCSVLVLCAPVGLNGILKVSFVLDRVRSVFHGFAAFGHLLSVVVRIVFLGDTETGGDILQRVDRRTCRRLYELSRIKIFMMLAQLAFRLEGRAVTG